MTMRSLILSARLVIAFAAIAAVATPAHAGLALSVSGTGNSTMINPGPGGNTGTGSINGFNFFYALTQSPTDTTGPSVSSRTLALTVVVTDTGVGTTSGNIAFSLVGSGLTVNSGYTNPTSGTLSNSLTASTGIMSSSSSLIRLPSNSTTTVGTNGSTALAVTDKYNLRTRIFINFSSRSAGGLMSATSTTTFGISAVPEPSGLVAGLMGLPCVAGVLTLARRRLFSFAPMA